MESRIRLAHSVDYSPVSDQPLCRKRKLERFATIDEPRKRRASSDSSGILARRNLSPMYIKTEPRSASLPPPEFSPLTTPSIPHSEVSAWEREAAAQDAAVAPGTENVHPPAGAAPGPTAPQHELPVQQVNYEAAAKAALLQAFAQNGVPIDMLTGGMGARIANTIADSFSGLVQFTKDVQNHSAAQVLRVQEDNAALQDSLDACNAERRRVEDEFAKFRKRTTQRELEHNIKRVEAKLDKLRAPDVTLEEMKTTINGFEAHLKQQDRNIDTFKNSCEKELNKLSETRKTFNRESRAAKEGRKHDIQELSNDVQSINERMEEKIEELSMWQNDFDHRLNFHQHNFAEANIDLMTLKKHVKEVTDDKEQQELNQALSWGLTDLRDNVLTQVSEEVAEVKAHTDKQIADARRQFKNSLMLAGQDFMEIAGTYH